jgi:D-sedoheptulose 7-phosphate isomerase
MTGTRDSVVADLAAYSGRLQQALAAANLDSIAALARALQECWREGRSVYLCGNGGSAGNAVHLANDLVYGIAKDKGVGMRAHALPANTSILTCLANDLQYTKIFSAQLKVYGRAGDVLVALSGSGNSPNILEALETARGMGLRSFAVLGYDGGKARQMADVAIHFPVNDMQIAEDLQLVVGHMAMQWLYSRGRG